MLLTVTMNPSVDISYRLNELVLNDINRTDEVSKTAGGKGLNVARVAKQIGLEVAATGILGGFLGGYINEQLAMVDIQQDFFEINQESRNCIAVIHEGNQTEILENGPTISIDEEKNFLKFFEKLLESEKYTLVTMSGSLPSGMDPSVYEKMIQMANKLNIPVVLDTSGNNLIEVLDNKSLKLKAIKPNIDELDSIEETVFNKDIDSVIEVLNSRRYENAEWIVLSLGGAGSLIKYKNAYYRVEVPRIKVISPVGSGDASVAGFAYGILSDMTVEDVMKSAMTTGVLNTMNEETGSINFNLFEEIFNQIIVEKL